MKKGNDGVNWRGSDELVNIIYNKLLIDLLEKGLMKYLRAVRYIFQIHVCLKEAVCIMP